jgi:hypothetical protein
MSKGTASASKPTKQNVSNHFVQKYELEWMIKTPPPQTLSNEDEKWIMSLKELFAIQNKNGVPVHQETSHRLWWLYRYCK